MTPDLEQLGPKMRALLDDRHRAFVWHYVDTGCNASRAATLAGFPHKQAGIGSNPSGHRLLGRTDIQDAITELTWTVLKTATIPAVKSLEAMVRDPLHKHHMKAVEMVLDRHPDFAMKTEHKVTVEHTLTNGELVKRITALAEKHGWDAKTILGDKAKLLPKPKAAEVEDAEFEDLPDDLSDLLP